MEKSVQCVEGFCISVSEIQAEAGLCVKIPCFFEERNMVLPPFAFIARTMIWLKCEDFRDSCDKSYEIFNARGSGAVHPDFRGRVFASDRRLRGTDCSITINDLTLSDSGSYQLQVMTKKSPIIKVVVQGEHFCILYIFYIFLLTCICSQKLSFLASVK